MSHARWAARLAPWLRPGPTPGSYQTRTPPHIDRRDQGSRPWAPYLSAVQVVYDPLVRSRITPRRV